MGNYFLIAKHFTVHYGKRLFLKFQSIIWVTILQISMHFSTHVGEYQAFYSSMMGEPVQIYSVFI